MRLNHYAYDIISATKLIEFLSASLNLLPRQLTEDFGKHIFFAKNLPDRFFGALRNFACPYG